mmetsp:Transcript_68016/g.176398  ORF Transcript_68016/g.176398 Transcript_68016/m.176398 type:complete len:213 (-) Transcript_68016:188-826(-)
MRYMVSMNSATLIEPLPSSSTMKKSCRKSLASMSRTRSQWRNSATFRAPCSNSSKESSPLPSSSIRSKIFPSTVFSSISSQSMSSALEIMSFARFSAKLSTITTTIKFNKPNPIVKSAPAKTAAVPGKASITGIATKPQLSPATTVWKRVNIAVKTEEKAPEQRGQSFQTPCSATSCANGWMTSTAMTAQKLIANIRSRNDQTNVFRQLSII